MIFKKTFFIFLSLYCFFGQSNGQDCVPSVTSVTIAANSTLFWETDPEKDCQITSFTVDVVGDQEDEYHFAVPDYSVDLSFLPICERWRFTVTPISFDVVGFPHTITSFVPLPPSANLNLGSVSFRITDRTVILAWDLSNRTQGDCSLKYSVIVENQDLGVIHDYYYEGKSAAIPNISPCLTYIFTLRAINQAHPTIEGPMRRHYLLMNPRVQFAPTLQSIDIQPTAIDMTWNLEGDTNRCPLSSFHIDGGAYFNSTVSLQNSPEKTVSVHIDSLLPDRMYQMTAFIENSAGRSPGAPIAVQTLELSPN